MRYHLLYNVSLVIIYTGIIITLEASAWKMERLSVTCKLIREANLSGHILLFCLMLRTEGGISWWAVAVFLIWTHFSLFSMALGLSYSAVIQAEQAV